MDIMRSIEEIVSKLQEVKQTNDGLQRQAPSGSIAWHHHERIDDRLHEVLAALGQ